MELHRSFFILLVIGFITSGCATTTEVQEPSIDDCVSSEGQRFLTFCASPDAAELARRHHTIEKVVERDEGVVEDLIPLPAEGAPIRGAGDASITIHLFSDLRCSECRTVYERLSAEVDTRSEKVRLVFRHAPRDERGASVARAAIAAAEQGKFFEFVDTLYGEDLLDEGGWSRAAEMAGLDVDRFEADRRTAIVDAILESDAIRAEELGVVKGPTFFINGKRMIGAEALAEFDEAFAWEAEQVEAMEESGLRGAQISWRRVLHNYEPVDWERVEASESEMAQDLRITHVPVGDSPVMGAATDEALVTVVLFADFECPYSAEIADVWAELVDSYADQGLRLVFRHFPLPMHDDSELIAAASVLAHRIDRFWSFHDEVFASRVGGDRAELAGTLRDLGWEGDGFSAAVDSPEIRAIVERDRQLGRTVGVEGTPTVFVNGIQLMGVWTADELEPLVVDQLELARSIADVTENSGEELYLDLVEINRGW